MFFIAHLYTERAKSTLPSSRSLRIQKRYDALRYRMNIDGVRSIVVILGRTVFPEKMSADRIRTLYGYVIQILMSPHIGIWTAKRRDYTRYGNCRSSVAWAFRHNPTIRRHAVSLLSTVRLSMPARGISSHHCVGRSGIKGQHQGNSHYRLAPATTGPDN